MKMSKNIFLIVRNPLPVVKLDYSLDLRLSWGRRFMIKLMRLQNRSVNAMFGLKKGFKNKPITCPTPSHDPQFGQL
jgi:hypothetical protein